MTITRLAQDRFRIITGTAFAANDAGWIRLHLPGNGSVEIRDVTRELACLGLWGPRARSVLQAATEADLSNAAFPYMHARPIDVVGTNVWAQRISYVGELGWELYVSVDQAPGAWDAIMEAGQAFGILPAGYRALESLRLEKGYRYWSADITPVDNPYQAGLGADISLSKGDFIGRDALIQSQSAELDRKLCGMRIECKDRVIYGGEAVLAADRVVGRVRTGGYGYTVKSTVAYAYLPVELADTGTKLAVEVFGERFPAEVVSTPLYDPQGRRLRAAGSE